ncbi:MAG: DUF3309 family protein [Candidatus Paceibacterota bacterium]|jgi:hypothetical protein
MKKLLFIVMLLSAHLDAFARAGGHGHGWGSGPSSESGLIILIPFILLIYAYIWWEDRAEIAAEKERSSRELKKS